MCNVKKLNRLLQSLPAGPKSAGFFLFSFLPVTYSHCVKTAVLGVALKNGKVTLSKVCKRRMASNKEFLVMIIGAYDMKIGFALSNVTEE